MRRQRRMKNLGHAGMLLKVIGNGNARSNMLLHPNLNKIVENVIVNHLLEFKMILKTLIL